uniref:Uncharacterized protein n=1 Tax=Aegilops tauschii subsp. strangulata TaxID=200361 RepID=A0A453EJI2_AEGTS
MYEDAGVSSNMYCVRTPFVRPNLADHPQHFKTPRLFSSASLQLTTWWNSIIQHYTMHLRFQWIPVEAMWSSACMLSVSW